MVKLKTKQLKCLTFQLKSILMMASKRIYLPKIFNYLLMIYKRGRIKVIHFELPDLDNHGFMEGKMIPTIAIYPVDDEFKRC